MTFSDRLNIENGHEFMAGFDSSHDDAFFGGRELPGGLSSNALTDLGLYPCQDGHDESFTEIEVLTGACTDGIMAASLKFELGYSGLARFVDGYRAYKVSSGEAA